MSQVISIDGVDRASVIRYPGSTFDSNAWNGEAGTGTLLLEDEAAVLDFPGLKIVRMTEDASGSTKHLYRGRVMTKEFARGSFRADDSHQKVVNLSDSNWDLRRLRVHQWSRPSETGRARVVALAAYILNGASSTVTNATKRNSTVINATTYVPNTNLVTMDAHVYDSTDPYAVIEECARAEGKTFFVFADVTTGNMFLFYDLGTSTAIASTVSITDEDPDGETTFAPAEDGSPGAEDPTELLSGAGMVYGQQETIAESRPAIATAHDVAEDTIYDSGAGSDAATRLSNFLDVREEEELRYSCSIEVRDDQAHLIQAGQTISFRWAAANALTPTIQRIVRCAPEKIEPDRYRLHLELSFPEKVRPRIQNHGQGTVSIRRVLAQTSLGANINTDLGTTTIVESEGYAPPGAWNTGVPNFQADIGVDLTGASGSPVCDPSPPKYLWFDERIYFGAIYTVASIPAAGSYVGLRLTFESSWDAWSEGIHGGINGRDSDQLGPVLVVALSGATLVPSDIYGGGPAVLSYMGANGPNLEHEVTIPYNYVNWGGGMRFVFIPLFRVFVHAICEDLYSPTVGQGGCHIGNETLKPISVDSIGWITNSVVGTQDGLNGAFTLLGGWEEIESVSINGLDYGLDGINLDSGSPNLEFLGGFAPVSTDTVMVRYRMKTAP
jgi:hypothetical protein